MTLRKGLKRTKKKPDRVEEPMSAKTQLKLMIDPEIKQLMQEVYGKKLSKIFEEESIARLIKDGYLKKDKEGA